MKIIQRADYFNFSLDSVLVSEFLTINRGVKKILDLGTGNGSIPMLLSSRSKAYITGIEIQEVSADLARRNIKLNNLENQVDIIQDDLKNWKNHFRSGSQDAVISNPPFFKFNGNTELLNDLHQLTYARHEITANLEDIISTASGLLKDRGYFALVHRPDRMLEILDLMRKHDISPKRLQFCHSKFGKPAKTILLEGIKYGKEGIAILPPLYTHTEDGSYSPEVLEMFK
ncbi:tRNA1(Val) (adenine(37)-N6)-methyltransferase [uncultured Ilyobacter sp.]|uniref:tRNA1(Val) (adenine(37)-N6)-methyltransferase n=1 Tax=uncultured Ilyobacter sp. TaxID=544433 RepID=UPI0029F473F5|nr:tRNA1(Val) (adenine(37)-N6)-methyltransferase [uncultured Ilyobacter sp.]